MATTTLKAFETHLEKVARSLGFECLLPQGFLDEATREYSDHHECSHQHHGLTEFAECVFAGREFVKRCASERHFEGEQALADITDAARADVKTLIESHAIYRPVTPNPGEAREDFEKHQFKWLDPSQWWPIGQWLEFQGQDLLRFATLELCARILKDQELGLKRGFEKQRRAMGGSDKSRKSQSKQLGAKGAISPKIARDQCRKK